jgi:hypothetical protein
LFVYACIAGSPIEKSEKEYCIVEAHEYPGKDPFMWDGLYAASDGRVYTGLISEGASAHFYVYEPEKNSNRMIADLAEFLGELGKGIRTTAKLHNQPVESPDGSIYFVTMNNGSGPRNIDYTSWIGGYWMRYDPKTYELENLGLVDEGVGLYPLVIDPSGKYLYGIGFTGYFYRFDIEKRETKNFGRVSNWDICRKIFCDDKGNVYGTFPVSRVFKYDAEKEHIKDLSIMIPFDPTAFPSQMQNPMIDRTYEWRSVAWDPVEKVAYAITCGSGSMLFKYDPHDGPEGKITTLDYLCDPKFYRNGRKEAPYSTLAFALDIKNQRIYFAPSGREYALHGYLETFQSLEENWLIMYDLKKNKRIELGPMKTTDGRAVYGCEGASVAPDGTLYLCAQVEVDDPSKATYKIGDVPVAQHLLIYRDATLSND